jgi:hypothetical protein
MDWASSEHLGDDANNCDNDCDDDLHKILVQPRLGVRLAVLTSMHKDSVIAALGEVLPSA